MAKRSEGKGKDPKAGAPQSDDAKARPAKSAGSRGNGAASEQPELDFAAPPAPEMPTPAAAPAAPPAGPAAEAVVVVELVNGVDGVWKKLSNGKRVDLTTKEWRHELARLFTRAPAP
jgi:hypothetical protein